MSSAKLLMSRKVIERYGHQMDCEGQPKCDAHPAIVVQATCRSIGRCVRAYVRASTVELQ